MKENYQISYIGKHPPTEFPDLNDPLISNKMNEMKYTVRHVMMGFYILKDIISLQYFKSQKKKTYATQVHNGSEWMKVEQ